ncbi:hypothetical protein [Flavobacterium sp.]|uniref:hypothetical protein n=1 Tax=Flavobacterium sp. TaxID=239 RepID=UPI00260877F0|nr:hypothetical protein [Flavobacterium sp.]
MVTKTKLIIALIIILASKKSYSQCFLEETDASDFDEVYISCENQQLDNAFQTENTSLRIFFGLSTAFYFYDDINSGHGKNALFTPEIYDANSPNGTILFGLGLLENQISTFNRYGAGGAIPFIFAHEMGHAKANQMGWYFGSNKKNELFADFCAGVFMQYRQYVVTTDIESALTTFFQLGNYDFNSPGFHGTPEERVNAVKAGYNFMVYYKTYYSNINFTDNTLYFGAKNFLNTIPN